MYCPLSSLSNGEKLIVLVNSKPLLEVIPILDDDDVKLCLFQLTITRDDDTPSTTVTVQVRVWFSPLTDPSSDCVILTDGCGTEDICIENTMDHYVCFLPVTSSVALSLLFIIGNVFKTASQK